MQERISQQIEELPTLEKAQLVSLWTENFGKPPSPNLRKGLMIQTLGGVVPLGYDLLDHQLILNPEEAEKVRAIFRAYLAEGCVSKLH